MNRSNERYDGPDLYHYTDQRGAQGIQQTHMVKSSKATPQSLESDLVAGPGIYLSSLDPQTHTKNEILQNNYGSSSNPHVQGKADYSIKYPRDHLNYLVQTGQQRIRKLDDPTRPGVYVMQDINDQHQHAALERAGIPFAPTKRT